MISDEMLVQATAKAAVIMNEGLPEPGECSHQFSAKFERQIKKIVRKSNYPVLYRTLRSAAIILFVMMIGLGSVLAINAEAREVFWGWAKKQYESFYAYFFDGASSRDEAAQYCPGWIPDGHRFITVYEIEGGEIYVYSDENGGITTFAYSVNPTSLEMYIQCVGYEQREVSINGLDGVLYISPNSSESSELVWTDNEKGVIFNVSAHVSEDELIKIAVNIVAIKK